MAQEVEFNLAYIERGERKTFPLKIYFVSNWCMRKFNEIMQPTFEIKFKWDRMSDLGSKMSTLRTEGADEKDESIRSLQSEFNILAKEISSFNSDNLIDGRFELVKQLLSDNGYKQEFLFDFDFWDRQVDPNQMIEFLTLCIWKDIDKKKV